jgi:hypothetical protein
MHAHTPRALDCSGSAAEKQPLVLTRGKGGMGKDQHNARLTRRVPADTALRTGSEALLSRVGQQRLFQGFNNPYWRAFLHQLVNSMPLDLTVGQAAKYNSA